MNNKKDAQRITLSDGRQMGFAEYGDEKGTPLFFLHGWPGSRQRPIMYHDIAKKLRIRLISPDRPGYGLSDYKKDRTLLEYPDDLLELATCLSIDTFSVVGVSGGGPYAAACAYNIPKKIIHCGIVVGLGPITVPHILDDMYWIYKLSWGNYATFPFLTTLASIYRYAVDTYAPDWIKKLDMRGGNDQKIIEEIKPIWQAISKEIWRQGWKGAQKDLQIYSTDWGFNVQDIQIPVHLWYGEKDLNINLGTARYYHSHIKNSTLTIYPNEGHLISITHAEDIYRKLVR